jgi:hypothetical protein
MDIWHYHPTNGRLLGAGVADPHPLEPNAWLIPAFAAATPPPEPVEGHEIVWEADVWVQREIPAPPPPPEPPPPQPVTLTARQLRLGLLGLGVTGAQVDAAIAAIPDEMEREAAMIEWRHASEYRRDHPLIASVSAALGIPAATIDAAWSHAATL